MAFTLPLPSKKEWQEYSASDKVAFKEEASNILFITRSTESHPWPIPLGLTEVEYQTVLLEYYRLAGFPYYDMDDESKKKTLKSLLDYDHSKVFRDGALHQTMHGLGLAWTYFHHMWEIKCNNMRTPAEVFNDDTLFIKAIMKRLKWGTYISDSGIRKALRSYSGTQAVSNFRPSAAAAIYHHFLPESGGVTWDMSSGFGGRLLGAMSCYRVRKYIGTDPSTPTMEGLRKMQDELLPLLYRLRPDRPSLEVELHKVGSEDYSPEPGSIDLCFTSPPYFNCEKYSPESTQSYIKFPSQNEWLNGFIKQTLDKCRIGLKPTGTLVINIAGVKDYPELHDDFVSMANSCGFKLEQEIALNLSRMMGTRKNKGVLKDGAYKTEPVFVMKLID